MKPGSTNDLVDLVASNQRIQSLDEHMAMNSNETIRMESLKLAYEMFKGSTPPGKDRRSMPPFDRYNLGEFMDEADKIARYINTGSIPDEARVKR